MPTTTSLLKKLSTIFSSKRPYSRRAAADRETGTAEGDRFPRLSLRFSAAADLCGCAVACSGDRRRELVGDIERETQRRREIMTLVAEEAAHAPTLFSPQRRAFLDVIDALAPADICSSRSA